MRMKNTIIILLLVAGFIFVFNSCATSSESILIYKGKADLALDDNCSMAGRILVKNSNKPLIGANIIIVGTACAAGTNKSGCYLIENIPPGVYDIKVSYIGFESFELSNFNFEKGEYYLVDFELLEPEPSFNILKSKP